MELLIINIVNEPWFSEKINHFSKRIEIEYDPMFSNFSKISEYKNLLLIPNYSGYFWKKMTSIKNPYAIFFEDINFYSMTTKNLNVVITLNYKEYKTLNLAETRKIKLEKLNLL